MKKYRIITAAAALLLGSGAYAQYYGRPFYKEGFENESDLAKWTINNTLSPSKEGTEMWNIGSSSFGDIDESSQNSLNMFIEEEDRVVTTVTSPVIDATGKRSLFAGLFGKDAFSNNYNWAGVHVYFEIKEEGTADDQWEILYESPNECYSTDGWGWYEARRELSSKYDGKKFRLRIRVRCNDESGAGTNKSLSFDGVYVAENYANDATVTAIGPNGNLIATEPTTVSITVKNKGADPMTSFKVAYSVNGGEDVVQDVSQVIQPGDEAEIVFDRKADFTEFGKEYILSGKVMLDGDEVTDNNTVEAKVYNILTAVPYVHEIVNRNSTDFWDTPDYHEAPNKAWYLTQDRNTNEFYWTMQGYGNYANKGCLYSRPAMLAKGQSITTSFTAWGVGTGDDCGLEVYYAKYEDRYDISKCVLLKSYTLSAQKMSDKLSFEVPSDGAYCIMFFNNPVVGGKITAMNSFKLIETPAYDGAVISIDAPAMTADEYSVAETVTATISNVGLQPMVGAKARLTVAGTVVATEDLPEVAGGESIQYSFKAKADMSNGQSRVVKVELIWDKDVDVSNNEVSGTFVSDLASPPYSVSLYSNDFKTHWSWTDNNNDGNTFDYDDVYGNTRLAYNIGGNSIAKTDETLYSRTLRLTKGKTYKTTGRVSIWSGADGAESTYNCSVDLYKVEGSDRTFVKTIDAAEYSSNDGQYTLGFDVPETGKYCIAFHLTKDTPATTKCGFQDFTVEESGDVELILSAVNLPGTVVSGYNRLPYSVRVTNNGLKEAVGASLKITSESLGTITEPIVFETPLKPGSQAKVAIEKPLDLNITKEEVVTFELVAEGDVVPDNNKKTVVFNYLAPAEMPYTVPFDKESGWLAFDNDGDGRAPEFNSWSSNYDMSSGSNGDWLMSRTFNVKKDTPYHITYSGRLSGFENSGKVLDVYALNVADGTKINCGVVVFDSNSTPTGYSNFDMESFMQADKDGVYALVFDIQNELDGYYPYFYIGGTLTIEAMQAAPDIKMTAITSPAEDKVFTKQETVTASYVNAGSEPVNGMNFSLKAGDNTYYAYVAGEIAPQAEGTVTFTGVDLYTPGEYELLVTAELYADGNIADNTVSTTVKSLYVYDVNVVSIDGPDNGPLGAHEHVVVSIKNDGHGTLLNTPVTMVVTDDKGSKPVVVNEVIEEPIEEGETLQYSFKAESDFSQDATYTVTVSVNLAGDVNADNNTVTGSIVSTHEDMDAGVVAIVGPTDRRMTTEEYIVIKVRNYSQVDLFRIPVQATVKFGDEEVAVISGVVPEVQKDSEVEYIFTTPVDIEHGGTYTVIARTLLPNDVNADNDSFEGTVYAYIKDCGVSRIISPAPATLEGKQTITVEIKNYGDVPMSNIPVAFKLGSNPQTDTYAGELQPGETVEYSFKSQYNFRANREYTLTAYTEHPEDENVSNDECVQEIKPTSSVNGVYADGAICIRAFKGVIIVDTELAEGCVEVYNAAGQRVATESINANETIVDIAAGVYLVKVASGESAAAAKVIVR